MSVIDDAMVTDDFARWACGYSGCDGGNPNGSIWVCGIEFGGGDTEESLNLRQDVSSPGDAWDDHELKQFLTYQYNWKVAKILCALSGLDVAQYREFFQTERCFRNDSAYFKLNLYPIGFKDTSPAYWQPWLTEKTGLLTKLQYKEWCHRNRFPVLRSWVQKYVPTMIVCTGKDYRTEFFDAFGDGTDKPTQEDVAGKTIWYMATNAGRTLVAVTYFLGGRHGLKSDSELSAVGKRLAELLNRDREKDRSANSGPP